jgi:hypothetical protein
MIYSSFPGPRVRETSAARAATKERVCPGGLGKWVLESEPQSLSCPGPPNWCYVLIDRAHGRGHRPYYASTPQAPGEAPKELPFMLVHCSGQWQSPFQRLAWPGTGVGWHAPGTLFVSKWLFLLPHGFRFSPSQGAQWAATAWWYCLL